MWQVLLCSKTTWQFKFWCGKYWYLHIKNTCCTNVFYKYVYMKSLSYDFYFCVSSETGSGNATSNSYMNLITSNQWLLLQLTFSVSCASCQNVFKWLNSYFCLWKCTIGPGPYNNYNYWRRPTVCDYWPDSLVGITLYFLFFYFLSEKKLQF